MANTNAAEAFDAVPPIILVVGEQARVGEYAAAFESEGLWVSTVTDPAEVVAAACDLRPDAVVADLPDGAGRFGEPLQALKSGARTQQIPVIAVSSEGARDAESPVEVWMSAPTPRDVLARSVRDLVRHSKELRASAASARGRARALVQHSNRVMRRVPSAKEAAASRSCPGCAAALSWIERGRIAGVDYDYYRWCRNGCGLYCYDGSADRWVKLA
jgi:CheY-like chemotaxis protein